MNLRAVAVGVGSRRQAGAVLERHLATDERRLLVLAGADDLRSAPARSTMELLPIVRRCLTMCEDWWMWRRHREADEARRLWDEFERTRPVSEPERPDEREVTLEEREAAPTAGER